MGWARKRYAMTAADKTNKDSIIIGAMASGGWTGIIKFSSVKTKITI